MSFIIATTLGITFSLMVLSLVKIGVSTSNNPDKW
ncbi:YnaM/YnfT family protein [Pseudocitrobacter faecalis]